MKYDEDRHRQIVLQLGLQQEQVFALSRENKLLRESIDNAYSMLLCGPDVGGYEIEQRCHKAMLMLVPHQISIG